MKIRPMSRSVIFVGILFFAALTLVLSYTTYRIFTNAMYERNKSQMTEIVNYIDRMFERDDMATCARTYVESPKFIQFKHFMDVLADYYSRDVEKLYIMQILEPGESPRTREICAGLKLEERLDDSVSAWVLGRASENWLTPKQEDQFYEVQTGREDVFLFKQSPQGNTYTLARPLISSSGDHYAVLCVDIAIDEINAMVSHNVLVNIGMIVLFGMIFIILVLIWVHIKIVRPLRDVEKSVADYAEKAEGKNDPEDLVYNSPKIWVRNEVWALAEGVTKLSICMQGYVRRILAAKNETLGLKQQVYQDALTHVKNKAAYDRKAEDLQSEIALDGAEFGILMADLNNLKHINDTYGHEQGNEYIIGGCRLVCEVFSHSPVYRIGGDEFVVVLEGKDFSNRDELMKELREKTKACMEDTSVQPWKRFSVAVGMSIYEKGDDVDSVLRRADAAMYIEKKRMKGGRDRGQKSG